MNNIVKCANCEFCHTVGRECWACKMGEEYGKCSHGVPMNLECEECEAAIGFPSLWPK